MTQHNVKPFSPFLLIAMPDMHDPLFKKAVVLVMDHSKEGAMGFILNRPIGSDAGQFIQVGEEKINLTSSVWLGGPVASQSGTILHQYECQNSLKIAEKTFLASSESALKELKKIDPDILSSTIDKPAASKTLYPYRFILGYSGWGSFQLDDEMRIGGWLSSPLDHELVFNTPWQELWDQAILKLGVKKEKIISADQYYLN